MRHTRRLLIAGVAMATGIGLASAASAQSFDAFKQFSIKHNPAGAWSYVAAGQLLTTATNKCNGIARNYCWTNGGTGFPNLAAAEANKTGWAITFADVELPAAYLDFDPQGIANVAFQWKAPAAGTVKITGNFLGVATDEGSHMVAVLHNGTTLVSYTIAQYQQKETFKLKAVVAAGDIIAFTSFTGNGGGALSTGLQAKISLR